MEKKTFEATPIKSESLLWKTAKIGVFAALTGAGVKKLGKASSFINEYSDLITIGAVSTATLLNNDEGEENLSRDLFALGTVFGMSSGVKHFRNTLIADPEKMANFMKKAESLDENIRKVKVIIPQSWSNLKEDTFNIMKTKNKEGDGIIRLMVNFATSSFESFATGVGRLFKENIKDVMDDVYKKSDFYLYQTDTQYKTRAKTILNLVENEGFIASAERVKTNYGFWEALTGDSVAEFKSNEYKKIEEFKKFYKKMSKMEKLENSNFFKSMFGQFSKVENGKIVEDLDEIIASDTNYISSFNALKSRFEEQRGRKVTSYDKPEEIMNEFRSWLNNNTVNINGDKQVLLDKINSMYNETDKIKFGDLERYVGKKFSARRYDPNTGIEIDIIPKEERVSDKIVDFIQKSHRGDKEIFEIHQENVKHADGTVDTIYEITGIKDINFLRNFTLTDVVKKGDAGVIDNTSLNPFLMFNRVMQTVENNTVAFYDMALSFTPKSFKNIWNPASLLDTKNRRKEYFTNNLQRFSAVRENGADLPTFLVDGMKFATAQETVFKNANEINDLLKESISRSIKTNFYADNEKATVTKIYKNFDKVVGKILNDDLEGIKTQQDLDELILQRDKLRQIFVDSATDIFKRNNKRQDYIDIDLLPDENGVKKAIKEMIFKQETMFYTDGNSNYKQYFQKGIVSATSEEASGMKVNMKRPFMKGRTRKETFSNLLDSDWNPFTVRYELHEDGKYHFRFVDPKDDFTKDGDSIVHSIFAKFGKEASRVIPREIDAQEMELANRQLQDTIRAVMVGMVEQSTSIENADPVLFNKASKMIKGAKIEEFIGKKLESLGLEKAAHNLRLKYKEIMDTQGDAYAYSFAVNYVDDILKKVPQDNKHYESIHNMVQSAKSLVASKYIIENNIINEKGFYDFSSEAMKQILNAYAINSDDFISKDTILRDIIKIQQKEMIKDLFEDTFGPNSNRIFKNISEFFESKGIDEDVIDSETNALKNLISDYFKAMNLATQDTFLQTKGNIKKLQLDQLKAIKGQTDLLVDEKRTINLANRLYKVFQDNREMLSNNMSQKQVEFVDNSYNLFSKIESALKELGDNEQRILETIARKEKMFSSGFSRVNDLSLEEKAKIFQQRFYTSNGKESASVILRDTVSFDKTLKEIFYDIRRTVLSEKQNQYISLKKNKILLDGERKTSYGFFKNDNFLNAKIRSWISSFEDSLEPLGIARLQGNLQREKHWNKRMGDVLSKRVGVFLGIGAGLIAMNSFVDALLPDATPLIGQGLVAGVAKTIAGTRVAGQFILNNTGVSSVFNFLDQSANGALSNFFLTSWIGEDYKETYDVLFKGKAVRVNKNRFWFTAGRQSGSGEEFDQYRPHVLYTLQNPTTGVRAMDNGYIGKWQKFFRQDFLPTKYPWYLIDPYREERIAYEKYGAVYPVTEQLFKDIPIVGDFMSATLGQIIKPTRYIGEEQWRVGKNLLLNPKYNPKDPDSPKYLEFNRADGISALTQSVFGAFEDFKTFAGLRGYAVTKMSQFLFGKSNPYQKQIALKSISEDISYQSKYRALNLGGFFDMTEPIRRILDEHNSLDMTLINPVRQKGSWWLPEYFKQGNNPALSYAFGTYITGTEDFNNTINHTENQDLNRFRILSMISPNSKEFEDMKTRVLNKMKNMTEQEKTHYYESLGYAEKFDERIYANTYSKAKDITDLNLTIKEKLSPYEFIATNNKRYKLDTVTTDFNKLSKKYGRTEAMKMMSELDSQFQEGQSYTFKFSKDANYSAGIDNEGDFFRIDHNLVNNKLNLDRSGYRNTFTGHIGNIFNKFINVPLPMIYEKFLGNKTVLSEWSNETVQSPYFRDWDDPVTSFIEPYYTFSANSYKSFAFFNMDLSRVFEQTGQDTNFLAGLTYLGLGKNILNTLTGKVNRSSEYEEETKIHDLMEQMKYINGKHNVYELKGNEYLASLKKMVNEQDAEFLKDLINVKSEKDRREILKMGNDRLKTVLQMVWNRQQEAVTGETKYNNWQLQLPKTVNTHGVEYDSNQSVLKNRIKRKLGYSFTKLDSKRQGIYNAYVGSNAEEEFHFINRQLIERYNSVPKQVSSIYPTGIINIGG